MGDRQLHHIGDFQHDFDSEGAVLKAGVIIIRNRVNEGSQAQGSGTGSGEKK